MKLILSYIFLLSCLNASGQVFIDSLLSNGLDERPHKEYSEKERKVLELDRNGDPWVISIGGAGDFLEDEESMEALLLNDFYKFYHNTSLDFSTPLKRKRFEQTEEYKEWKEEMNTIRDYVLSDTLHMPIRDIYNYSHEYDVDNGCFLFSAQGLFIGGIPLCIPNSLKKHFKTADTYCFSFYAPIQNWDVAAEIEDQKLPPYSYDFLIRFKYRDKEPKNNIYPKTSKKQQYVLFPINKSPYLEVVDVILYKVSTGQVVWSMLLGDLSDTLH